MPGPETSKGTGVVFAFVDTRPRIAKNTAGPRDRRQERLVARIAGVNIPTNKRVLIALQYIHGIGQKNAAEIMEKVKIPDDRRVNRS